MAIRAFGEIEESTGIAPVASETCSVRTGQSASLERAGFEDVRPNPPLGAYRTVAARRP